MDELISRQAAIDALAKHEKSNGHNYTLFVDIVSECAEIIRDLPPAQPERKKGHYIGEADGYADGELVYDIWSCSECGCYFEDWDEQPTYSFCPNCGADMRGETDE